MSMEFKGSKLLIVLTTESDLQNAKNLAKGILKRKLAVCIGLNKINSMYWWKNELQETSEVQLKIKTRIDYIDDLYFLIKQLHSYELPEFICIKLDSSEEYNKWLVDSI